MTRTISRRKFITTAAVSLAATRLRAQGRVGAQVTLRIPTEAAGPHMPADFVGLSYEVQQLTAPSFFAASNIGLIRQCKALAPHGVLRLGGNTSEFAWWKPTPESPEPEHPQTREVEGEPKAQYYAVTPEAVRNLADSQSGRLDLPVWHRDGNQYARARGGRSRVCGKDSW
jgi:hypothetical protein